jgi:hypothetical protein
MRCRRAPAAGGQTVKTSRAIVVAGLLMAACGRDGGRAPDPANELPFGVIDVPADHAQVAAQTAIGGWALDDKGIAEIRLYIDNHFVGATKINTDRGDVSKVYPTYAAGTNLHGWTTSLVFDTPGAHTILVQAVDSDGATRDIGTRAVTSLDK